MFGYSVDKFAKQIIKVVSQLDPSLVAHYDPVKQHVTLRDTADESELRHDIFLGNIHRQARGMGFIERRRWIRELVSEYLQKLPLKPDELLATLRGRIRTPYEVALKKRVAASDGPRIETVTRGAGDLLIELVSDRTETVATVNPDQLAEANVTEIEAFSIARAALSRMTDAGQWKEIEQGIWISTYSDDYDFARLIALAEEARLPFKAAPIAYAPSHSTCLITDRDNPETLKQLVRSGNELSADHRPLSQLLWVRASATDWREYHPADDHPAASIAASQRMAERALQYDEQKFHMDSDLEDRGQDIFVANFMVATDDDDQFSVCAYTFDNPSYLPKTDMVAVIDPRAQNDEEASGMLPWADFAAALGPDVLKLMPDEDPPRYALLPELTPDQKSAIRARRKPIAEKSQS